MFGSRENSKPEKCSKMPQNPTRQVHALLAGFEQDALIENQNQRHKTDKIIARTLFFSKNQKNFDLPKHLLKKNFVSRQARQPPNKQNDNFAHRGLCRKPDFA